MPGSARRLTLQAAQLTPLDLAPFAFGNHFKRATAHLAIGLKLLPWNARIHRHVEALD